MREQEEEQAQAPRATDATGTREKRKTTRTRYLVVRRALVHAEVMPGLDRPLPPLVMRAIGDVLFSSGSGAILTSFFGAYFLSHFDMSLPISQSRHAPSSMAHRAFFGKSGFGIFTSQSGRFGSSLSILMGSPAGQQNKHGSMHGAMMQMMQSRPTDFAVVLRPLPALLEAALVHRLLVASVA